MISSPTDNSFLRQSLASTTTTTTLQVLWNSAASTVAGFTLAGGSSATQLSLPYSLAVDSSFTIYIADRTNNRIQKWLSGASTGTTVAGQASATSGTGLNYLNGPCDVILDSSGNMYISDTENHRVFYWVMGASSGTIVAGTGTAGTALNQLDRPHGLALDSSTGTLYIAEYANNRVMQYLSGASSGTIVAGGNGAGLGSTQLDGPIGISFDSPSNTLFICNNDANNLLLWVVGNSTWTLFAGSASGTAGSSSTLLCNPTYVRLDSLRNVYVGDRCNDRVQFFPYGQTSATTIAGTTGNGGSASNLLNLPSGVAIDSQFNIYVADNSNNRVQLFIHT